MGFYFLRKKIQKNTPQTTSLSSSSALGDIFFDSKKRFVSFKKKYWVIKINKEPFQFLTEKKELLRRCAIFLLVIFCLGFFSPFTSANVSTFYPTTCLGGWERPENATGEPTLSKRASSSDYTLENSARLENASSPLYCGGFKGTIPKDTKPTTFKLSFAWAVQNGVPPIETGPSYTPTPAVSPSETQLNETPSTNSEGSTSTTTTDASSEPQIIDVTQTPEPVSESTPVSNTPENTSGASGPSGESGSDGALSFIYNLLPRVFAQESESTPVSVDTSTVSDASTTISSTSDVASTDVSPSVPTEQIIDLTTNEQNSPVASEEVQLTHEGAVSTDTTSTEQIAPQEITTDAFLKVAYTLDGTTWKTLGTISRTHWKDVYFDIPLENWENLNTLQVSVTSLPTFDAIPPVYLDAMMLDVEYDEIKAEIVPPTVMLKDSSSLISGKTDFTSNDTVEFSVSEPTLDVEDLKSLVQDGTAEVVEDHTGVLDQALSKIDVQEVTTPPFELQGIKEILEPVIQEVQDSTQTPIITPPGPPSEPLVTNPSTTDPLRSILDIIQIPDSAQETILPVSDAPVVPSPVSIDPSPLSTTTLVNVAHAQEEGKSDMTAVVLNVNGEETAINAEIVTVMVNGVEKKKIHIQKPEREFKPGRYTLKVTLDTASAILVSQQDFTWGVLTINTDKSIYQSGDDAYLQMGVLNDSGHTLCHADLDLHIKTPNGNTMHFTTEDTSIIRDEQCGPDNVIAVPDYYAHYTVPNEIGSYEMTLTAVTANGVKTITDHFEVQANPLFDVRRKAPTRIYPVANYPVTLFVTSPVTWSGVIMEKVPASFGVSQPVNSLPYESTHVEGDEKIISWNVTLEAGEQTALGYMFDAPNISPEIFLLGPLEFQSGTENTPVFTESRYWQIASDAACNATSTGTWGGTDTANFTNCTGAASTGTGTGNRPGTGDVLTIDAGVTVTVAANVSVGDIVIADPTTANGISINTGVTLTVTTSGGGGGAITYTANTQANPQDITLNGTGGLTAVSITIPAPSGTGASNLSCASGATGTLSLSGALSITGNSTTTGATTVTVRTCTFSVSGLTTITGGTNGTGQASITVSTGTLTTAGGITFAGTAANAKITTSGAATHNITGTISSGGTFSYTGTTTVKFTGTSAINGAYSFPIVQVNSGTTTLGAGTITFGGSSSIANGATLQLGNFAWTMNNALTITGTLNGGTGSTGTYAFASTLTVNSGGVLNLTQGTHAKTYGGTSYVMNGTTWNTGTGTDTFQFAGANALSGSSAMTFGGTTSIPASQTLTNNNTNTVTFGAITIASASGANGMSLTTGSTTVVNGAITYTANANTNAQTITMNGTANLTANSLSIPAPTSTGASRVTCATSATGTFTINSTLAITGNSTTTGPVTIGMLTCTLVVTSTATITGGSNGTGFASITSSTGTLTFSSGITYAGTAANARVTTSGAGTINVTGTISSGGTLTLNAGTTTKFTGTSAINGAYTLTKVEVNSGTTTLGTGTITFSGASSIANGATLSLGNFAFTMSGSLTIGSGTSGTLSVAGAGNTGTYTFSNTITVNSGGIFNLSTGTHAVALSGTSIAHNGSTFNTGTGAITMSGSALVVSGSSAMTFGGTMTISAGGNITNSNTNTVTIGAVTFSSASTSNSLTLSTGSTTSVTGAITYNTNSGGNAQSININGTANLNAGSITMNAQTLTSASQSVILPASGASGTITVTGATTITGAATTSNFSRIDLGINTNTVNFTTGSLSIVGGAGSPAQMTMSSGTLTVNGNVTFSGTAANAQLSTTSSASIVLINTTMSAGGTTSIASATVSTSGTTALNGGYTLPTLSVTSGTTTIGATTTVTGALAVSNGATLSLGNFAFTASGTTTVGSGTSGTLSVAGAGNTGTYTFSGNVTVNAGGTFNLSTGTHAKSWGGTSITHNGSTFNTGTGTETITGTGTLTLSGSSAMTFGGAMAIPTNRTLTNSNTNTVTIASLSFDSPVAANNLSLTTGSTTNITGALTFTANGTANNQTVTMNGTANITVGSLSIPAPTSTGSSNITCAGSATGTFTVSGTLAITGNSTSTGGVALDMLTCTLVMNSATTITGGTNATGVAKITSSTGVLTTTGGISFAGTAANAQLTTTGAGTINLTGSTIGSGGTLSINSGTDLISTNSSQISGAYTFGILHVNSSTLRATAALTFAGNITIASSATLRLEGNAFTVSGTTSVSGTLLCIPGASCTGLKTFVGLITVNSGGTLDFTQSTVAPTVELRGGVTASSGATLVDFGSGATTFATNSQALGGAVDITFGGAVTVNDGVIVTNNNLAHVVMNGGVTISRGNTGFSLGNHSILSVGEDITFASNSAAGSGQIITLNGDAYLGASSLTMPATTSTGTAKITCASGATGMVQIENLTSITGSSTASGGTSSIDFKTVASSCAFYTGTGLTIAGGTTGIAALLVDTGSVDVYGNITFGTAGNVSRSIMDIGATTVNIGGGSFGANGTVTFNSSASINAMDVESLDGAYTFPYFTVVGGDVTVGNTITMTGDFAINSGFNFILGGYAFTATGSSSISGTLTCPTAATCTGLKTFQGPVTIRAGGLVDVDNGSVDPSLEFQNGIDINISAIASLFGSGATAFTTNDQSLTGAQYMTFNGTVTIANGIALTNSDTRRVTFGGTVTGANSSSTFATDGSTITRFKSSVMTTGMLIPSTLAHDIEYDAATGLIKTPTTNPYYNLIVNSGTRTLESNLVVSANLSLPGGTLDTDSGGNYSISTLNLANSSGILIGNASTITVGGNWTNTGTFTAGTSTVILNTGTTATVTGTTTFYNLTITHTAAKQVNFAVSGSPVFAVTNTFSASGVSGGLVKLYSTSAGTQWHFLPTGTASVNYVDTKDSACDSGSVQVTRTNWTDSGNNGSCWSDAAITFDVSDASIGFGTLTTANARWATGDTLGSSSDTAAHTVTVTTTAPGGYVLSYIGALPTSGSNTISGASVTNDSDGTPGTSQFGIGVSTTGTSTIASGYDHNATAGLRDWSFVPNVSTPVISSSSAVTTPEVISTYYLGNISSTTASGNYSTNITYLLTGTF